MQIQTKFGIGLGAVLLCFLGYRVSLQNPIGSATAYVSMNDPQLAAFSDMYAAPRTKLGFTPLPKRASVMIETRSGADAAEMGYEAMLHMYYGNMNKNVWFKRSSGKYKWVGEQDTYNGPDDYVTDEGDTVNEMASMSYTTVSGTDLGEVGHTDITYMGNDHVLASKATLTVGDLRKGVAEWRGKAGRE